MSSLVTFSVGCSVNLLRFPKNKLDWETMNKLAKLNNEFSVFIKDIKVDLDSKRIHISEYDKVLESDEIEKYLSKIIKK